MKDEIFGTGACGINCLTCGLGASGRCSPCGPGNGPQAARKLGAQLKLLGGFCPILKCAADRGLAFCLRDCREFPCEHFEGGPYPFSQGFLDMQRRRRQGADLRLGDDSDLDCKVPTHPPGHGPSDMTLFFIFP